MTYDINFNKGSEYLVIDDEDQEALSVLKRLFALPEETTEIRIYDIDASYFVEEK